MYETPWKLVSRNQPYPETTSIQVLRPPHHTVRIPTVVLQQGPFIISHENPWKNIEKGCHLDPGSFQNFTYRQFGSYRWAHPYQASHSKTYIQVLASICRPPKESTH